MKYSLNRRFSAACASALIALMFSLPAWARQVDVADELKQLAATHGFDIKGLDQVDNALGRAEGNDLFPRLRRLLKDFDHVIVQAPRGSVERVIILGAKVPYEPPPPSSRKPPNADLDNRTGEVTGEPSDGTAPDGNDQTVEIVLETVRHGNQHAVKAGLEGKGGKRADQSLLVDTGADNVVLPASLIVRLGLSQADLSDRDMQTANGKVTARFGKVESLWLGETRIPNVDAAFVDDAKLGNSGLLGMSVLSRYTMTIDDETNRITLSPK